MQKQKLTKTLAEAEQWAATEYTLALAQESALGVTATADFDPSMTAIRPSFTAMFNEYVRRELGYVTDEEHHILRGLEWDWGSAGEGHPETADALRCAFAKNSYLHLFIASGYYDLATPYFSTDYTVRHLGLDPSLRGNVRSEVYPVGHMVYLEETTLATLKDDVVGFMSGAMSDGR